MIVAATGHRPDKLGGYGPDAQGRVYDTAYAWLDLWRPDTLISGMALGWDQACAEAALTIGIPVIAAVPFVGQESKWPASSQAHYHALLAQCVETRITAPGGYNGFAMQLRNERMVDWADLMLALWDGSIGGTFNCVQYAQRYGARKPIVNLWETYRASSHA